MTNPEKYNRAFLQNFNEHIALNDSFSIANIESWDSVAHMKLVADLEETFGIMFDANDIIEFSSYENGKSILQKYNIII